MKYSTFKQTKQKFNQAGVVLFVALIALLVLSLAAVGLIRSVDTSTLIAGNLAFKQSAKYSSDHGIESAIAWLNNNPAQLEGNSTNNGYFAGLTKEADADYDNGPGNDKDKLFNADTWSEKTAFASGDDINLGVEANSGNTIRYIIQRMCKNAGPADSTNECLYGAGQDGGNSNSSTAYIGGAKGNTSRSPIYRVTARVDGPKNTVSYTQAFVF
jgi:type IV pilus assembly protein PilX